MDQDGEDEALLSALEYEAIEVKCLLLEPQDYVSIYGVLGGREESPKNNPDMDDVSSRSGIRDLDNAREGEDNILNKENDVCKTLQTRPNEAEVGNFQVHNDLYTTCEDYLLDIESAEISSDVNSGSSKGSQGSLLKSQLPISTSSKYDSSGMSVPSGVILRVADYQNNIVDTKTSEANGISSQHYGCGTSYDDNKWSKSHNSFTMHTFDNLDDVSNLVTDHVSSDKDNTDMFLYPHLTCGGTLNATTEEFVDSTSVGQAAESSKSSIRVSSSDLVPTQKRPRRPTRRYVEESAEPESVPYKKKRTPSASKGKIVRDKGKDKHTRPGAILFFPDESCVEPIQVPFGPLVGRESSKRDASPAVKVPEVPKVPEVVKVKVPEVPDSDDESSMNAGKNNCISKVKTEEYHARRKHHRLWTVTEVKRLIEGVAEYGVGKWSDIKNQFFSSSQHRTSVDLKDKWRNLLKASRLQTELQDSDSKRNPSWRPLPISILNRVNELANIYPYPRLLKSKVSHVQEQVSSPISINENTDASPNKS